VRSGLQDNDLRDEIVMNLVRNEGYKELNVNNLIRDENERGTEIGQRFNDQQNAKQTIPSCQITDMLRKIIYSGNKQNSKFVLTTFPEVIE
jgi:hypothetical protein